MVRIVLEKVHKIEKSIDMINLRVEIVHGSASVWQFTPKKESIKANFLHCIFASLREFWRPKINYKG